MEKKEISMTRTQYSEECAVCGKPIKASSENGLEYNMKLHMEKHEREGRA